WQAIIERYPDATIIGMTATPCRGDGRGLGNLFETMIECPQIAELIGQKHLVPARVYAPSRPDLSGVHVRHGDYVEGELRKPHEHARAGRRRGRALSPARRESSDRRVRLRGQA